jgi:hypothetical protein
MKNIINQLEDLHKQAVTERSHYYTAKVIKAAIEEIKRLQEYEWMYKDLCK